MKLEQFLKEADKKPATFAAELGVAPSTITRILRGERTPRIDLIAKIAQATGQKVAAEDWFTMEPAQ
jgi:transcriptional regulator with XRE-family HTH domain